MRAVIKQKVHSALCNDDAFEAADKAKYEDKVAVYDKVTEELVTGDAPAERTAHKDIQPSSVRIKNYKHKMFGKRYEQAV